MQYALDDRNSARCSGAARVGLLFPAANSMVTNLYLWPDVSNSREDHISIQANRGAVCRSGGLPILVPAGLPGYRRVATASLTYRTRSPGMGHQGFPPALSGDMGYDTVCCRG